MTVSLTHEGRLWDAGALVVAGMDEVGRGALAGPVSVGVMALERCAEWPRGLADSKQLTPARRVSVAGALAGFGVARAVGHATAAEIDDRGIVAALRLAGMRALGSIADVGVTVDAVLLDGRHDWLTQPPAGLFSEVDVAETPVGDAPVTMVVKGDTQCVSIAAASVLAKVDRDAAMVELGRSHPYYGWDANKGYGSPVHLEALRGYGASQWHRRSWSLPTPLRP